MAVYEYECPVCGVFEDHVPMRLRNEAQECKCGASAKRVMSRVQINPFNYSQMPALQECLDISSKAHT